MTREERIAFVYRAVAIAKVNATSIQILTLLGFIDKKLLVHNLAALVDVSNPCISRNCDALETMGLIKRTRDPEDRRKVFVTLTARGNRLLTEMVET